MSTLKKATLAVAAGVITQSGLCFGQLIVGTTTTVNGNASAYYVDLSGDQAHAYALWPYYAGTKSKVNGIAANDATGQIFTADSPYLSEWNYGSRPALPAYLGGMYRYDGTTAAATGVDDLVFANGNLYCWTSFGSTIFKHGIYQVPTTSNAVISNKPAYVLTPVWTDPTAATSGTSGTYDLKGITYNSANSLFYGVNTQNGSSTQPGGIYTVDAFGTGALTKIADFPSLSSQIASTSTGWDGLALGNGKLWLTEYDGPNAQLLIISYDLATQTYDYGDILALGLGDAGNRSTGAAWTSLSYAAVVPEPATFGLLLPLGAAALVRRRK